METYQYHIDDILSAVYSPETADPDFLRDSAAQYAEACAEANDRLREVARLLHRGLRSEALQLAEEEPNLLDTVSALDFPELPAWCDLLEGWGMVPPPSLLIELAADINQAYADQQPLESLLKQHRLFALARAPLEARIKILRNINNADSSNTTWEADLLVLEKARIKQIGNTVEGAYSGRDLSSLAAMVSELSDDQWMVPIPDTLITHAKGLHEKLEQKLALKELEQIEVELNAAHMALNPDAAREVRSRWESFAKTAMLTPDNPLAQRAAPALEWLDEEDRIAEGKRNHSVAIAAIEQALEDEAPAEELDRLYQSTLLYDDPIPPYLKSRVDQRLDVLSLGARRKHRFLFTIIAVVLLVIGALVVYVIIQQTHNSTVARAANALQSLAAEGRYDNARKYYEDLAESSPKVANSPEVQIQKAGLDDAIAKEQSRVSAFESNMSRAEQSGPQTPDRVAITEANQLAVSPSEKARVAKMESQIAAVLHERQMEQDKQLAEEIKTFLETIKDLESKTKEGIEVLDSLLDAIRQDIESVKKELPAASSSMRAQLEPLLVRIGVLRKVLKARVLEIASKNKITAAVGNVAAFRSALEDYATAHPDSSIATNMPQLRNDVPLWEGVLQWTGLSVPIPDRGASDVSAEQAANMLKRGRELQSKFGNIPLGETFQRLEGHMESIASRAGEDGSTLLQDVKGLLTDHLIRKLWMLEDENGLRYYCRKQPQIGENSIRFKYIAGFDLREKDGTMRPDDILYNDLSPQSIASEQCMQMIEQIESKGWERTFTSIVKIILNQEKMDPILKIVLLKRILETATKGSKPMEQAFADYQKRLDAADVDLSAAWMDPRDKEVLEERTRAEILLDGLPGLEETTRDTASRLKLSHQEQMGDIHWIGWLHLDRQGDWQLLGPIVVKPDGDLFVIDQREDSPKAAIHDIGITKSNNAVFSGNNTPVLLEGRPIFLRKHP